MPWPPPFSESDLRAAIAQSLTWAATLRVLGYEVKGANYRTLQRWTKVWGITTDHFDPNAARRVASSRRAKSLAEVMVENSTYPRGQLKDRLFADGLKQRVCELCGQGEMWNGRRMSLVLDHINGVANDHRMENLRVVCGNCAATLETHCGRNLPRASGRVPAAVRCSRRVTSGTGTARRRAGARSPASGSSGCLSRICARSSARRMSSSRRTFGR